MTKTSSRWTLIQGSSKAPSRCFPVPLCHNDRMEKGHLPSAFLLPSTISGTWKGHQTSPSHGIKVSFSLFEMLKTSDWILIAAPLQQTALVSGTFLSTQYLLWLLVSSWDRKAVFNLCDFRLIINMMGFHFILCALDQEEFRPTAKESNFCPPSLL